jgi:hypothetical protein
MALSRIVMRLARNPATAFADGDDHRGYTLCAPITPEGRLDEPAFHEVEAECVVRGFTPDEEPQLGRLAFRGGVWSFDYDDAADAPDTVAYRLGEHRFLVGEYVSIADEDGVFLTYKVTEVGPA